MNTSIPQFESKGLIQPSGDSSPSAAALSALRNPSAPFLWVALVAGLLFLLLSAPSVRAWNPVGCTGSGLAIEIINVSSLPPHVGDTIVYQVTVGNAIYPACSAGEINPAAAGAVKAYVVMPNGSTNNLPTVPSFLNPGDSFATNISYVVGAGDVRPDNTVIARAYVDGTSHGVINQPASSTQPQSTPVQTPCVRITAQCVQGVGENGQITFTGTVTNCGSDMLVGLTVTNFVNGSGVLVLGPINLDTNQVVSFSGSWVPSNPCLSSTATLTVWATDQFTATPKVVTDSKSITCQNTLTPGIKVTKACGDRVSPGQLLTFSGSVSNSGNVTLTNIVVVNNQPANNTTVFSLASLAPGVVATFNGSYLAPTNCSVADTLTATAWSACGVFVTGTTNANCPILTRPQIAVTAVCPTAPVYPGGGYLLYSGTVTNTGNITLTNVVVRLAANTIVLPAATLAPGASTNFSYPYYYPVPANACMVTNTFSATGQDICTGSAVANDFPVICKVTTTPAIAITQDCPKQAIPGGQVTYSGTVSNAGNITLTPVIVNNQCGSVFVTNTLAPGAVANFTCTYVALTNCSVTIISSVTAQSICGDVVANAKSTICPITTTPAIVVTQGCPNPPIPGVPATYSGTVSNAGDITLTNVVVVNNPSGQVFTFTNLPPGAVSNFNAIYVAPAGCSSTSTSTATGWSACGVAVTNTASATCTNTTTPAIAITQGDCPKQAPGGRVIYSGTVSNAGNITLTQVMVNNNQCGSVFVTNTLVPGAVANFTCTYVALTNCSVTIISSVTAQSICGDVVAAAVSKTCPITTTPAIAVTQVCPPVNPIPGGWLNYSGTVSNAGNITLTNVLVINNQPNT